jgi:hypothetical protein
MGLDLTHDCWSGAYSAFMRWRTEIAKAAGLPPLELMAGFYSPLRKPEDGRGLFASTPTFYTTEETKQFFTALDALLPISWECLKPSPLHILLHHSDCDGDIKWKDCGKIADELEKLLPNLPKEDDPGHIRNWREKTQQFIDGLRAAHKAKENVEFH